jgi:hypothetical protein
MRATLLRPVFRPALAIIPRRQINIQTFYTEESVAGTPRTPNKTQSMLPLYVDGKKYDTRVVGLEVIPNAREILLALYAKCIAMCDSYGVHY